MIKVIQLTNLSCNLINSDLLKNRLNMAKLPVEKLNKLLFQLFYNGIMLYNEVKDEKNIEKLNELGFIKIVEIDNKDFEEISLNVKRKYTFFPIRHIEAVNFELTYDCNSNCPHCILKTVRQDFKGIEMSFDNLQRIIADAYFAGLLSNGINFTGGESLLSKVDIFDLLKYASSYGIPTRLFTNSFWGNRYFFKAGNKRFPTALSLVKKLKSSGLNHLALSFDSRMDKEKAGIKQLTAVIQACETIGLQYEIISSPQVKQQLDSFLQYIKLTLNTVELKFMTPITMELVDMGGASVTEINESNTTDLKELIGTSLCKGKGYYQPSMITIAPNGNIRSCMFGVGLSNLGNINESSLFDIINDFDNEVTKTFANKSELTFAEEIYEPFKDIYKPFSHSCSACVLLANLIQEYSLITTEQKPSYDQLLKLNIKVAGALNLLKATPIPLD